MANVVDGQIEWLKDEATGVPVGFKKKDGTEGGLVTTEVNPLTGEIELIGPDGQPISVGGGGITPDATGTLAGRAAHNAAAVGFVYLATDQVPAEYYFREGAAGNWSAAVTVRGPTGAQGSTGDTGPAGADGVTFVSGTTAPNNADGRPNGTVYVRYTA